MWGTDAVANTGYIVLDGASESTVEASADAMQDNDVASASLIDWLEGFRREHRRSPRILHIGNIANNAYNNAKILNRAGIDCDVLCADYYHIMGCPEWEDADFEGDVRDQFRPKWIEMNLNGFERERWFAQGPRSLCIQYLIASRENKQEEADSLWRLLGYINKTQRVSPRERISFVRPRLMLSTNWFLRKLADPVAVERRLNGMLGSLFRRHPSVHRMFRGVPSTAASVSRCFASLHTWLATKSAASHKPTRSDHTDALPVHFHQCFPDRQDQLTREDVLTREHELPMWRNLFDHYDIIQAYAADVMFPLLTGHKYVAFEHGTLRDIPFWENDIGRLTALGYHDAEYVLVTNTDCLDNARRLAGERAHFVNHPYDEDHGLQVGGAPDLREQLCRDLSSTFLIFFPTRHDWVPDSGYADKANDVLIRAFAEVRRRGCRVGLVCCRWGSNIEQSRKLIAELGCEPYVQWVEPMGMVRFDRTVQACDAVADQFKLGSFGGVTFKAMSVGVPLLTYLDEEEVSNRFAEIPPVVNCRSVDDAVASIIKLIESPEYCEAQSVASRAWIKKYHSGMEVVEKQCELYKAMTSVALDA